MIPRFPAIVFVAGAKKSGKNFGWTLGKAVSNIAVMERLCADWTLLFAFTEGDRWRPGIGDPTFMGWFTVGVYLLGAFYCWRAATKARGAAEFRRFWLGLAVLLLALGINKQLDLQTAFTFAAKDFAKATGWYESRRGVQRVFVVLIALTGSAGTAGLFWHFRREWRRLWSALAGLAFLLCFIVIRASSFHDVDMLLKSGPGRIRMNWILELGGIAAIAFPAWRASRHKSSVSLGLNNPEPERLQ
jgi:hypothetical protein